MIGRLLALALLLPALAWATCPLTDAYSTAVCADNPKHYFRLDDMSGTTVTDVGANGSAMTYNGGFTLNTTSLLSQIADKAVALNGSTGYLRQANASTNISDFYPTTASGGGWSIEFWVNPSVKGFFMTKEADSGSSFQWEFTNNPSFTTYTCGGGAYGSIAVGASLPTDATTQVIISTLGAGGGALSNMKVQINGASFGTTTSFSGTFCGTDDQAFSVGRREWGGGNFVTGTFDEISQYASQLSDARALAHFNAATIAPGLPNMGRRIFQSRRTWFPQGQLPPIFGVTAPAPFTIVDPTFVVEALNKRGLLVPSLYDTLH